MGIDTYNPWSIFDHMAENEDRTIRLRRLIAEDAALRPWLVGKAIRSYKYTIWERVTFVIKETYDAAVWAWRLSK